MNSGRKLLPLCALLLVGMPSWAQIPSFQHIVLIIQENRTPDNLFQGLCVPVTACSTKPTAAQYNIQTSNWLDKGQVGGVIQPLPVPLATTFDLNHLHPSFVKQCDFNTTTGKCAMDGASQVSCTGVCPTQPSFRYVDNSTGILNPYLLLAKEYGWANYMFQTNQGPSFPAHQFLFGGTSAPSASDDAAGTFAAENLFGTGVLAGCIATSNTEVRLITPPDVETQLIYPCFDHQTIPDVLPTNVTWRYYAPGAGSIWTAPDAIQHICQPTLPIGGTCVGPEWVANVDLKSADALTDIQNCKLRNLSWIVPTGQNSDHPLTNTGGGPAWVSALVNAIGTSNCKNPDGSSYWDTTAILITWDDWGGWYDHEPPTFLPMPQGDYQYGFRVPLIVVSAYTKAGYIDNGRHDFGSILRFIERNFRIKQGALNFADARSNNSLGNFFNLTLPARPYLSVPAAKTAAFFVNDTTPQLAPDND